MSESTQNIKSVFFNEWPNLWTHTITSLPTTSLIWEKSDSSSGGTGMAINYVPKTYAPVIDPKDPLPKGTVLKPKKNTVNVTEKSAKANSDITWKDGSVTSQSESPFTEVHEGPLCNVGVSAAQTINMGNYNSVRIGVDIHIPCKEEDLEKSFTKAHKWVDEKMIFLQNIVYEAKGKE